MKLIVKQGVSLPKITGRGRPKGAGCNIRLLRSLRPEDTVWEVGVKRMRSIVATANRFGIRLMVRKIPNSNKYAFKVIHESPVDEDHGGQQQG